MRLRTHVIPFLLVLSFALVGCGDDAVEIFLRPLDPNTDVTLPVGGTPLTVWVELSDVPSEDMYVDIKNDNSEYLSVVSSLRFRPEDDPPKQKVEISATKANNTFLPIVFSLRDSTTASKTIRIRPIDQ